MKLDRKKYLIGAGVVVLLAVPALALQGSDRDHAAPGLPVTRGEIQAQVRERFAALDLDRNGTITAQEVAARRAQMAQERAARDAADRAQMFGSLDTDKNGQLSPQEFAAARGGPEMGAGIPDGAAPPPPPGPRDRLADRRDGPGGPGGPDGPGGPGGPGAQGPHPEGPPSGGPDGPLADRGPGERWIAWTDSNEDGKLTLAEAMAKPLARFDRDDANHDGIVTPTEREQSHSRLRQAWRAVGG